MFQPTIYPIQTIGAGSLSVMARPVPGEWIEDEFAGIARLGISHIVSLLEHEESIELGLEDEPQLAEQHGMLFTSFPVGSLSARVSRRVCGLHTGPVSRYYRGQSHGRALPRGHRTGRDDGGGHIAAARYDDIRGIRVNLKTATRHGAGYSRAV